jgi:hypothetical protein
MHGGGGRDETRRERCKCECKCKLELELQETESRSNPSVTLTRSLSFICMQHSRPNGHIMRTRTGCHVQERERSGELCVITTNY